MEFKVSDKVNRQILDKSFSDYYEKLDKHYKEVEEDLKSLEETKDEGKAYIVLHKDYLDASNFIKTVSKDYKVVRQFTIPHITPTLLKAINTCPADLFLNSLIPRTDSSYALTGTVYHKVMELYMNDINTHIKFQHYDLEKVKKLQDYIPIAINEIAYKNNLNVEDIKETINSIHYKGKSYLENYVDNTVEMTAYDNTTVHPYDLQESNIPNIVDYFKNKEYHCEEWITNRDEKYKNYTIMGNKLMSFDCVMDRLDIDLRNNILNLIDYKTGRSFSTEAEINKHKGQMLFYSWVIKMKYGKYPDNIYLICPGNKKGNQYIKVPIDPNSFDAALYLQNQVLKGEEIVEKYVKSQHYICNNHKYCKYRDLYDKLCKEQNTDTPKLYIELNTLRKK